MHVDPEDVPDDLVAMQIETPVQEVAVEDLPRDWNREPDHPACIEIGDRWAAEGQWLALRVPSAVVPEESNILLNPAHPDARRLRVIRVRGFTFDPRLR